MILLLEILMMVDTADVTGGRSARVVITKIIIADIRETPDRAIPLVRWTAPCIERNAVFVTLCIIQVFFRLVPGKRFYRSFPITLGRR